MIKYILTEEQKNKVIDFDCVFAPIQVGEVWHLLVEYDFVFDENLKWITELEKITDYTLLEEAIQQVKNYKNNN